MILLLFVLCVPSTASALGRPTGKEKLPADSMRKYQACDHDSDCVRATNGCCDCANGGEAISVHRKHEKAVRELFPCKDILCTEMAGECMHFIPYCEKKKGSKQGLCALRPPGKKL